MVYPHMFPITVVVPVRVEDMVLVRDAVAVRDSDDVGVGPAELVMVDKEAVDVLLGVPDGMGEVVVVAEGEPVVVVLLEVVCDAESVTVE